MEDSPTTSTLASEFGKEVRGIALASLVQVDISCSHVKSNGAELLTQFCNRLQSQLQAHSMQQPTPLVRIIITLQQGHTSTATLSALASRGFQIKICMKKEPPIHFQGWLFSRTAKANDVAFVKYSSISKSALRDEFEYNVRVVEGESDRQQNIINNFRNTFELYWNDEGGDWRSFDQVERHSRVSEQPTLEGSPLGTDTISDDCTLDQHILAGSREMQIANTSVAGSPEIDQYQSPPEATQQGLRQQLSSPEQQARNAQLLGDMRDPQVILDFATAIAPFSRLPQDLFAWQSDSLVLVPMGFQNLRLNGIGSDLSVTTYHGEPKLKIDYPVTAVVISSNELMMVASWLFGEVEVWDLDSGKSLASFQGLKHDLGLCSLAFSANGETLFHAAICKGRVRVKNLSLEILEEYPFDETNNQPEGKWSCGHALALSQDSTMLAAVVGSGIVYVWKRGFPNPWSAIVVPEELIRCMAFSNDNLTLATYSESGSLSLYHTISEARMHSEKLPVGWNTMTFYEKDGDPFVAMGSTSGSLLLSAVFSSEPRWAIQGAKVCITGLALLVKGNDLMIAIGSNSGTLKLWRAQ